MLRPKRVPGYDLRTLRHSKRCGRARRRFCDKIGHGDWMFTFGGAWLDGMVIQNDSGWICGRCGHYLAREKFTPKLVQMIGVA